MGTWRTFDVRGDKIERDRSDLVARAVAGGVDLFDSSPMYGEAERVLGRALGPVRDRVLVATKVWTADDAVARRQISDALGYFGGRVDLYQVHNLVAWPARVEMLENEKRAGRVRAIGATHFSEAAYGQLRAVMESGTVDVIQIPYNPVQHLAAREILPLAADLEIGVVVMRPFGEGELLRRPPAPDRLKSLAEFGIHTWPQALLKWALSDPRCQVALPATRSPLHLAENLAAGVPPWLGPEERDLVEGLARGDRG
jgi:aryl-alcohol dehydrogenase-like predicted oxidoreductase